MGENEELEEMQKERLAASHKVKEKHEYCIVQITTLKFRGLKSHVGLLLLSDNAEDMKHSSNVVLD